VYGERCKCSADMEVTAYRDRNRVERRWHSLWGFRPPHVMRLVARLADGAARMRPLKRKAGKNGRQRIVRTRAVLADGLREPATYIQSQADEGSRSSRSQKLKRSLAGKFSMVAVGQGRDRRGTGGALLRVQLALHLGKVAPGERYLQ